MPSGDVRPKPRPGRPLRIVVADDDRDAVVTLSTLLQGEGHDVRAVHHGDAVYMLVRQYRPDAVLLDIGMPGVTGFENARRLHEDLRQSCPLLIAVTAWNQEAARQLGKLTGFKHYLTKPYSIDELLDLLAPLRLAGPGA